MGVKHGKIENKGGKSRKSRKHKIEENRGKHRKHGKNTVFRGGNVMKPNNVMGNVMG
jgi:hypothetical protein